MKNNKIHKFINDKKMQKQILKYLLVGGFTALFELILYTFLRKRIYLNLALSNIIATVIATLVNFLINRGWSFKSTSNISRSLTLYIILFCLNTTFSTNAISIMVNFGVMDVFAKFMTMIMITTWNFVLYRKVIFK